MRATALVLPALLLLASTRARAGDDPAAADEDAGTPVAPVNPGPPGTPSEPVAPAPPPAAPVAPVDPNHARREALFDVAMAAMASGRLELAEQAFDEAAALPGDPVRAAVAASFAERVRRLRAARVQRAPDAPAPRAAPLADEPAVVATSRRRDSEGWRTGLLATTSVLGFAAYGWALPLALGLTPEHDGSSFIGLYMLTAGSSFLAPYLATRGSQITPAETNLAFYGATRGLWHGVLLAGLATGDISTSNHRQLWAGSMVVGSVSELVLGALWARDGHLTSGEGRTIAVGGDFGLGWGFATGAILGLDHDDHSVAVQTRGMAAAGLVGSAAGLGLGYVLARRRDNTWGDGEVLRMAGLVGTWAGVTADVLLDWRPDTQRDDKKFFLTLIAGGAAGLLIGDRLVRPTNFSVSRALILDLATVAGAFGGAGLAYVFGGGADVSGKTLLAASAVGAMGAFALSYWAARDGDGGGGGSHEAKSGSGAPLNIAVVPAVGADGQRGVSLAGMF
jgi:hypothetical protein